MLTVEVFEDKRLVAPMSYDKIQSLTGLCLEYGYTMTCIKLYSFHVLLPSIAVLFQSRNLKKSASADWYFPVG